MLRGVGDGVPAQARVVVLALRGQVAQALAAVAVLVRTAVKVMVRAMVRVGVRVGVRRVEGQGQVVVQALVAAVQDLGLALVLAEGVRDPRGWVQVAQARVQAVLGREQGEQGEQGEQAPQVLLALGVHRLLA